MYFEFSKRSRSTSQPIFLDVDRKESANNESRVSNSDEANSSKNNLSPFSSIRSYSFRLFNNTSKNKEPKRIEVVKDSKAVIPQSVSFIYEVKNKDENNKNSESGVNTQLKLVSK